MGVLHHLLHPDCCWPRAGRLPSQPGRRPGADAHGSDGGIRHLLDAPINEGTVTNTAENAPDGGSEIWGINFGQSTTSTITRVFEMS